MSLLLDSHAVYWWMTGLSADLHSFDHVEKRTEAVCQSLRPEGICHLGQGLAECGEPTAGATRLFVLLLFFRFLGFGLGFRRLEHHVQQLVCRGVAHRRDKRGARHEAPPCGLFQLQ